MNLYSWDLLLITRVPHSWSGWSVPVLRALNPYRGTGGYTGARAARAITFCWIAQLYSRLVLLYLQQLPLQLLHWDPYPYCGRQVVFDFPIGGVRHSSCKFCSMHACLYKLTLCISIIYALTNSRHLSVVLSLVIQFLAVQVLYNYMYMLNILFILTNTAGCLGSPH